LDFFLNFKFRAHRIGQTRDVHIYRFIAKDTIEENILKKANYKRKLGNVAIEEGRFNIEGLKEDQLRVLIQVATVARL
jgi:helicase SWR1